MSRYAVVEGNAAVLDALWGIDGADAPSAVSGNSLDGNAFGTFTGCVETGPNLCGGSTTCP